MSQENVEVVRAPLRVRKRSSRTFDQRLLLRFPGLTAAHLRLIGKLPPTSRLRHAAARRGVQLGMEAYNRRDLEAAVIGWHPDFEYHPGRDWVEAGLVRPCYLGLAGYREYVARADQVAGGMLYLKPEELIDLGKRIVILADAPVQGQASETTFNDAFAAVTTFEDGRVIHAQEYFDHAEALEAAGLRE